MVVDDDVSSPSPISPIRRVQPHMFTSPDIDALHLSSPPTSHGQSQSGPGNFKPASTVTSNPRPRPVRQRKNKSQPSKSATTTTQSVDDPNLSSRSGEAGPSRYHNPGHAAPNSTENKQPIGIEDRQNADSTVEITMEYDADDLDPCKSHSLAHDSLCRILLQHSERNNKDDLILPACS